MLRRPTFVEIVLLVVIMGLAYHAYDSNQRISAINGTLEIMGLSEELVTTHMVRANTINFKLLERIERLENYDKTQVEFNDHMIAAITVPQQAKW